MASRDAALIAIFGIYGRRVSENVCLKKEDIRFDETHMYCNFMVLKKNKKPRQECKTCKAMNGSRAKYCGKCGLSLSDSQLVFYRHTGEQIKREVAIKSVVPLVKYVRDWWKQVPPSGSVYMFPVSDIETGDAWTQGKPVWNKHIARQTIWGILRRYVKDVRVWSHLWRDSIATILGRAYMKAGKDPIGPLCRFFFWDDPKLALYYTQQGQVGGAKDVSDEMVDLYYDKSALDK